MDGRDAEQVKGPVIVVGKQTAINVSIGLLLAVVGPVFATVVWASTDRANFKNELDNAIQNAERMQLDADYLAARLEEVRDAVFGIRASVARIESRLLQQTDGSSFPSLRTGDASK
jgi:hypothetical protein